jgi:hypothetical protein
VLIGVQDLVSWVVNVDIVYVSWSWPCSILSRIAHNCSLTGMAPASDHLLKVTILSFCSTPARLHQILGGIYTGQPSWCKKDGSHRASCGKTAPINIRLYSPPRTLALPHAAEYSAVFFILAIMLNCYIMLILAISCWSLILNPWSLIIDHW